MLPPEVLVEAAERLAGTVHDLLDGEIPARAGVEQLDGGVEEALHPCFGPEPGGVERPRHRLFSPTEAVGLQRVGRYLRVCHWGNATR